MMLRSRQQGEQGRQVVSQRDDYSKAINFSRSIRSRERRRNYLLEKAQNHLYGNEYDQAALLAWHILYQIDPESLQAKQILKTAYIRIFGPRS